MTAFEQVVAAYTAHTRDVTLPIIVEALEAKRQLSKRETVELQGCKALLTRLKSNPGT